MGRNRIEIELPRRPFTTGDLAEQYPEVSSNVFHVRLRELVRSGEVRIVGKRRRETKGKAWFLYERVRVGSAALRDFEGAHPR